MNTAVEIGMRQVVAALAIGQAFGGGFFAGVEVVNGQEYVLVVAPKALGEKSGSWNDSDKRVDGATDYADGLANTKAMAAAGSELAVWAAALDIDGFTDWYLPAQDELEILYRNLKPTTDKNYTYNRSGINLSAVPSTRPYTSIQPAQTAAEGFQADGVEAFDPTWYWSSTQHAGDTDYAWVQNFINGTQHYSLKSASGRARAVRRLPI